MPPIPPAMLTRLPEPEAIEALEAVAARAYGVADPACVVAAPGTQAVIHLLPRLLAPQVVSVLSPTYAEHAAAWALAGHRVLKVARLADTAGVGSLVVVRPNNPDGALADPAELLGLAAGLAGQGGLLVVDEAFADFEGCSLAASVPHPGLLLLRSFGKTYGLGGVRLGFALAAPVWAMRLRQAFGPWAVSGPALHAGNHALADAAWRQDAARRLGHDVARLDAMLARAGGQLAGGTLLFRLHAFHQAASLADRLAAAGILVRRFDDRPKLLRFGLPASRDAWSRLEDAIG